MRIRLTIDGEPMGKERPKFSSRGKYVQAYTPERTVGYEERVREEYSRQYQAPIFGSGEVWATVTAYFRLPKSHYRYSKRSGETRIDDEGQKMLSGWKNPTRKPDTDNIAKICLDALNGVAYEDDSQVTVLLVLKKWSERERVEIVLETPATMDYRDLEEPKVNLKTN